MLGVVFGSWRKTGRVDLEASVPKRVLDEGRGQARRVRIVENASQQIPGGERRLRVRAVHHEIVDENEPAGRERLERAAGKDGDVRASDRAPDIGH